MLQAPTSGTTVIALYRPGLSIVHRASAGVKLTVLVLLALGASFAPRTPLAAGVIAGATTALYLVAGFGPKTLWRQLWQTRWVIVLLVVPLMLFATPIDALVNTMRVVALLLLAGLVTMTTRASDMLGALETACTPLRAVGVDPARVALLLSLTLTLIPVIAAFTRQVRDAQTARGRPLGFRFLLPLLVLSLRHADDVGDALTARGLG